MRVRAFSRDAGSAPGLLGSASVYTLGTLVQGAGALLLVPFVTRTLGPTEYGAVAVAVVFSQFAASFVGLGLRAAVLRVFYRREHHGSGAERVLLTTLLAAAGLTGALLLLVTLPLLGATSSALAEPGLLVAAVALTIFSVWTAGVTAVLQAEQRPLAFVGLNLVGAIGGGALGLVLLQSWPRPVVYVLGVAGGWLVAASVGLLLVRPPLRLAPQGLLRWALALSMPTLPHAFALQVIVLSDRLLVERYVGLDEAGRYTLAYLVGFLGGHLVLGINNAWVTRLYGWDWLAGAQQFAGDVRRLGLTAAFAAGAIALVAPWALAVLAPASYAPSQLTVTAVTVAASVPLFFAYLASVAVLFHAEVTRDLLWMAPVAAVANVVLNVALIPRFGPTGAAAATVASYGLLAVVVAAVARHRVAPTGVGRAMVPGIVCGVATCTVAGLLPASGAAGTLSRSAGILTLGAVALFTATRSGVATSATGRTSHEAS